MTKTVKREKITEAALEAFVAKGYHDTRMEEIARKAGVGKGTLYEYFSNKEELFVASLEQAIDRYVEEINRILKSKGSLEEKIALFLEEECRFKSTYGETAFLFMRESKKIHVDFKRFMFKVRTVKTDLFRQLVLEAKAIGLFREDLDTEMAVSLLMGGLNQVHFGFFHEDRQGSMREEIPKLLEVLMTGFRS